MESDGLRYAQPATHTVVKCLESNKGIKNAKMRAKLTGENQSRKRLTERVAKELVPASLKKLNIPRSMDPSCPYSYSSGLQRLEEKTLNLSEPVKREIEKIKNSI